MNQSEYIGRTFRLNGNSLTLPTGRIVGHGETFVITEPVAERCRVDVWIMSGKVTEVGRDDAPRIGRRRKHEEPPPEEPTPEVGEEVPDGNAWTL